MLDELHNILQGCDAGGGGIVAAVGQWRVAACGQRTENERALARQGACHTPPQPLPLITTTAAAATFPLCKQLADRQPDSRN